MQRSTATQLGLAMKVQKTDPLCGSSGGKSVLVSNRWHDVSRYTENKPGKTSSSSRADRIDFEVPWRLEWTCHWGACRGSTFPPAFPWRKLHTVCSFLPSEQWQRCQPNLSDAAATRETRVCAPHRCATRRIWRRTCTDYSRMLRIDARRSCVVVCRMNRSRWRSLDQLEVEGLEVYLWKK